jgi:hypothetical protein
MLAACLLAAAAGAAPAPPPADAITVTPDHHLARGCRAWTPRGLNFFGRMVPSGVRAGPAMAPIRERFGPWILDAARFFGADTLRLAVGLPFIDPGSPQAAAGYLAEVRDEVRLARDAGFAVILEVQWEHRTLTPRVDDVPGASTLRAWRVLAPVFASDPGVIYELLNEPLAGENRNPPAMSDWDRWRAGYQAVVDDVRRQGVRNVLVIDGLVTARSFEGAPELRDPLGQLAFGLHPYLGRNLRTPRDFDRQFGRFAATHAVVATEWTNMVKGCADAGADESAALLTYLEAHRIGLVAYGADENPGRLLRGDGPGRWRATDFAGKACTDPDAGPGALVRALFARTAAADAAAPAPPPCGR